MSNERYGYFGERPSDSYRSSDARNPFSDDLGAMREGYSCERGDSASTPNLKERLELSALGKVKDAYDRLRAAGQEYVDARAALNEALATYREIEENKRLP